MQRFAAIALLSTILCAQALAITEQLQLELPSASVGGTLVLPEGVTQSPCVVIAGGTLSQTRDGGLTRPGVPERTALKRLAESLVSAGYGSFRYDAIGFGASKPKSGWTDLYSGDARVLGELMAYLRKRSECSGVIAVAESAGAYVASLAARAGSHADAYAFLGGFCGKAEEIFSYNHGRLAAYVDKSEANRAWAHENKLERYLAYGRLWREMFAAARAGGKEFVVTEGAFKETAQLARRREELDNPPDQMFGYIKKPALAIAGDRDRNVPPHHASCAVAVMQLAGNLATRNVTIPGADHNFQTAPEDEDTAIRERFTFASFSRPYHPGLDHELIEWLNEVAPVNGQRHSHGHEPAVEPGAATESKLVPANAFSPERFHLAPGVTIIDDILNFRKVPSVDTLEGRIGPLLRVPEMRAHFIDMPAGLYLEEHPHAKGSIIYTVRGTWGLKSLGRWHTMKPGSLYWFGDNIPTGFQIPFKENAYILIFKGAPGSDDKEFITYLKSMGEGLEKDRANGAAFRLVDLPEGHPALDVARRMNPKFDREFPLRKR